MRKSILFGIVGILCLHTAISQKNRESVVKSLNSKSKKYGEIAQEIWQLAEMGYLEHKSSGLLQETLQDEGFAITKGVAGIPTAFIAEYGSGYPVIAILGEYDALPGLSQQAVPEKKSANAAAGHACGHHLFGTASAAAAIEAKNWLKKSKKQGTVRFYGCPAEEGGSGKVYMVREGLFNDVDVALHWHPGSQNAASAGAALANKSAKFRFYGTAAHAAGAPERGRSALDGVEAMNIMVNMMREHIPQEARIHYVITDGGKAPNVVPNFAEVYYYARHNSRDVVIDIFDNLTDNLPELRAGWTDQNMVHLSSLVTDNYDVYSNFEINSVEDIANRRLNAPGTSANWLKDTGCTPVNGALTTYYTDIQTGVSEGALSFASGIQPTRVYEVAPRLTRVGFGSMYFGGIAVNKQFFDSMPAAVQTALREAGRITSRSHGDYVTERSTNAMKEMVAAGLQVTEMAQSEREKWAATLPNVAKPWLDANGPAAATVLKAYFDALKEREITPARDWAAEI